MILKIDGMKCPMCVKHVDKALNDVKGASDVVVSLEENQATVNADAALKDELVKAVEDCGYKVTEVL